MATTSASTKHVHAKVGGGRLTHAHDDAGPGHGHDGALPLPKKTAMADRTAVLGFTLDRTRFDCAEKRLPYLVKGQWHWDDYGDFEVGDHELDMLVRNFNDRARRQDLPVTYRGEAAGNLLNEEHNSDRAVGWLKSLERVGDRVDAVVETTPLGDRLLAEDAYRYTSPELLRHYTDAETGATYPMVATGLALTNKPRIKALGRIAASEGVPAGVLAFAEGDAGGIDPVAVAQGLLAGLISAGDGGDDPDADGDDDGPVPACVNQPGYRYDACPGFTRFPGDDDGDGTCLMATRGCNGYRAVGTKDTTPYTSASVEVRSTTYSEGHNMAGQDQAQAGAPPANPKAADAAEDKSIHAAERVAMAEMRTRLDAAEAKNTELQHRLDMSEQADRVARTGEWLERMRTSGRMTPAEIEKYSTPETIVKFSEPGFDFVREGIEARPERSAVRLGEIGFGREKSSAPEAVQMSERLTAEIEKEKSAGRKPDVAAIARRVGREFKGGR